MDNPTPLHDAIRAASLTDSELARRTGWTSQQINRVRRGIKRASLPLAKALERELGGSVTADAILAMPITELPEQAQAA
jgi:transcriptional regulator with XRE-family HTH domain